jgi:hypothetical protein
VAKAPCPNCGRLNDIAEPQCPSCGYVAATIGARSAGRSFLESAKTRLRGLVDLDMYLVWGAWLLPGLLASVVYVLAGAFFGAGVLTVGLGLVGWLRWLGREE